MLMNNYNRNQEILTCLYDEETKDINKSLSFVFLSRVNPKQLGFSNNSIDELYYYYDSIIVKAIYILDDERKDFNDSLNEDNIKLIKEVSIILKSYYYDLQRFEASVYHLNNILEENKLNDLTIGKMISYYELNDTNIKSMYKTGNKYLFGNMDIKNAFNNINYYLSNIFIFFQLYMKKSKYENIDDNIEEFKDKTILDFEEFVKVSLRHFSDINHEFVQLLKKEKFYER